MANLSRGQLEEVLGEYDLPGILVDARPCGRGHINDTYCVSIRKEDGTVVRYTLQSINPTAFKNPDQLMHNIMMVTEYLRKEIIRQGGDPERETLHMLRTKSGDAYVRDKAGGVWRVYVYVEDVICLQSAETPELFYASAKAFGHFQRMLKDFPAETLFETIEKFHDTLDRLEKFKKALAEDRFGRAGECLEEARFVLEREADCGVALKALREGKLPLRVTHNDTKLNNVLIDEKSQEGICVIDLDTVMPGLSINDFGDSIRFGANHCEEDERDLSKVNFDLSLYETYARGFLEGTGGSLTEAELEYLPWGARLMTLECGMRFLTDYLEGDVYFKTDRPGQNLDRCRTQFKLVSDMEGCFGQMSDIVARIERERMEAGK